MNGQTETNRAKARASILKRFVSVRDIWVCCFVIVMTNLFVEFVTGGQLGLTLVVTVTMVCSSAGLSMIARAAESCPVCNFSQGIEMRKKKIAEHDFRKAH